MKQLNADRNFRLPMYIGWLTVALHSDDVREFLTARAVTDADIEAAYKALLKVAGAFYYDPDRPTEG